MADAVLAVLSGTPTDVAAAAINTRPETLADAVETYQTAGYHALETGVADHGWYSIRIQFPDWEGAEQAAVTDLGPRLDRLQDLISEWWFIRKHPCWRLRLRPRSGQVSEVKAAVNRVLNDLATSGVLTRWWPAIYEPEVASFGGAVGTDIAHTLFCADSRHMLSYLRQPPPEVGRKEMSVLLCTTLQNAAGLDPFERGNLWTSITELRPFPTSTPASMREAMAEQIRPLVGSDTASGIWRGPCAFATPWAAAFRNAGDSLGEAAAAGYLDRGVRHVLTHLIIFHWNRLGLPAATQAILSRAASEALLPTETARSAGTVTPTRQRH
ncbi:thiopeptide-type bacteriocin biosynthesis protein [Nonomuraea gerenzanensis]|uniref:O-methyltransferase clustered with LanBC n=1 Tax=Nonomuraea gerenzanensis TaxID=93944 RepID=A0A1M4E665_9ACTN|nr:thiopeptide-type bacteriocin biosynthesis protein [Nonomuraea gerenzanensis]UBU16442.1 thiopeptide-type bacteriocin biosynthesis protein [Nonomuraea gerenzanensis]SBO94264.1 O-methyltransferase clustered with LanBC [Nonomuraea gerenzanensis]